MPEYLKVLDSAGTESVLNPSTKGSTTSLALFPNQSADVPSSLDQDTPKKRAKAPRGLVVKLCALYKPILRRFKAYFRSMFENLCSRSSTYQHWGIDVFIKEVRIFMKEELQAPEALLEYE